ncbi:hypothetical protein COP2_040910 [Malus domestica]
MFLIVGTNVPIVQESSIPQYMAGLARYVIMVSFVPTFPAITRKSYNTTKLALKEIMLELRADKTDFEEKQGAPDTLKVLGCIARGDEGLVQFQWLDHRLKLVKRNYELPTLYTMDWHDIEFGISEDVDLIAMSVVNSAESVKQLKNHLFTKSAKSIRVLAKIESLESLQNLKEIIEALNGITVARVDLGVDIPLEQIPTVPEEITNEYKQLNKLVIVAYQFLELVIQYPTPTHAKVADISEAVRQYAFNIGRCNSIVESLFDAFSQQWFSVKLIYAFCSLLILILGIVGMHYVVNLVGCSKEPIKSIVAIESIALVLAYFTNKRIITLLIYYGGRIGYGKEYRERLLGKWEVVDVNDCCSYALYLLDSGKIYGKHLCNTKIFHVEGSSPVSYRKPMIFADETCANQTAGNANFAPVFVQGSLTSVHNWYQLLMWAVVHIADEGLESITDTD